MGCGRTSEGVLFGYITIKKGRHGTDGRVEDNRPVRALSARRLVSHTFGRGHDPSPEHALSKTYGQLKTPSNFLSMGYFNPRYLTRNTLSSRLYSHVHLE